MDIFLARFFQTYNVELDESETYTVDQKTIVQPMSNVLCRISMRWRNPVGLVNTSLAYNNHRYMQINHGNIVLLYTRTMMNSKLKYMVHVSSFGLQKNFSILNFIWKMFWCMVILSIFTTDPPGLRMEDHRFNNDYRSLIQVSQSLWVWLKKLKKRMFTISLLHSIVKDLWNDDDFDASNIDIRILVIIVIIQLEGQLLSTGLFSCSKRWIMNRMVMTAPNINPAAHREPPAKYTPYLIPTFVCR